MASSPSILLSDKARPVPPSSRCARRMARPQITACASAPGKSGAPTATAAPANDQLYAVAWQQDAVEYEATVRSVYVGARRALAPVVQWQQQAASAPDDEARAAAANQLANWNAMPMAERANNDTGQPLAIILDADETSRSRQRPHCSPRRTNDAIGTRQPSSLSLVSTRHHCTPTSRLG